MVWRRERLAAASSSLCSTCCSLLLIYQSHTAAAFALPQSLPAQLTPAGDWISWLHEQALKPSFAVLDTMRESAGQSTRTERLFAQLLGGAIGLDGLGIPNGKQAIPASAVPQKRRLADTTGSAGNVATLGSFQGGPQQPGLQSLGPPTFPGVANFAISGQTNLGIAQQNGVFDQSLGGTWQTISVGSVPPQGSLLSGLNTGMLPVTTTASNTATLLYNPTSGRKLLCQH